MDTPITWTPLRRAAGGVLAVLLAVAAFVVHFRDPDPGPEGPVVTDRVVERALATERPETPTMTDEISHFRTRLAARGDERFSRRRLISAHLLRFRAYGDPADLEAAERHLAAAMERAPSAPRLLSAEASIDLLRHDFPAALEAARKANRAYGDFDSSLRLRLFDALWARGRYDRAEQILELPHDTASFDHLVRRARVLDRRGRVEEARDRMREALAVARAYAEPKAVEAWALVEVGHFEHHSGRPDRAVERYLEALEVLPGNPAAVEGLALIAYGVDRDLRASVRLFRRALELGAHLDAHLTLADAVEALGQEERAAEIRERFVRLATRDADVERASWRSLALVLAERPGSAERALGYARKDLVARPTPGSWDVLAWTLHRAGRSGKACMAVERAIASGGVPEPATLHRAGVVVRACGHTARSRELLERALEGRSELGPATVRRIEALLEEGG